MSAPLLPHMGWNTVTPADGSLLLPLDEAGLRPVIDTLRATKIEALAISFLHAYVNPAH